MLGGAAALTALVLAAGCQDTGGDDTPGAACGGKIATFGAFTGPNAGLVIPSLNGAKLAVKQHNDANPDCKIELVEFDTQGDPAQATPIANQVAGDATFIGVIGGHFSGESKATMPTYEAGGLVMVSPSATNPELTALGNKVFHRVVGNDVTQGLAAATYFKTVANSTKVFVIGDGTTYGDGIAAQLKANLGDLVAGEDKTSEKQTNFDATISKIKSSGADAVFYGGYTNEGAPLLKQMRSAGITAVFVGPDGLYDPGFTEGAGASAEGAVITCPCLPADKAGGTFAADFEKEYGVAPGSYGAEGYDAASVLISGIKAGKVTRADLLAWVDAYDAEGVSKPIKFDETGDVDKSKVVIWSYVVKDGAIVPLQELSVS